MFFKIFDESTWPLDNQDEISIGRAFQIVGRWKFGEKWDEIVEIASAPFISALPSQENAKPADRERAWSLLPESKSREPPTFATSRGISGIYLSPQDWQRAADALSPGITAQQDAYKCLGAARLAIRDACLSGALNAYAQIYNGKTLLIKQHLWKTERFLRWFSTGRASLLEVSDDPYSSDEPTLWVFFNSAQINRAFPPTSARRITKNVSEEKIDAELDQIFKAVENGEIFPRPDRDGVVKLVRDRLPTAKVDTIKHRFAQKRPAWWKPGPQSG
ncbi:hypothetical protein ACTDI4_05565 [Mesorhizobium sp. PUT5]|uniref:hypothetical protein n=1 Tax=Mesorhizobium sp. PUT5 TaxID=3454629 RepID=UPI003FA40C64